MKLILNESGVLKYQLIRGKCQQTYLLHTIAHLYFQPEGINTPINTVLSHLVFSLGVTMALLWCPLIIIFIYCSQLLILWSSSFNKTHIGKVSTEKQYGYVFS